jgi:Uri superfamily endonuclease
MELKNEKMSVEEKKYWHIDIVLKKVYYLNILARLKIIKIKN